MSRKIQALLIDLSGTIHIEDSVIPGSIEALERLRSSDIQLKFVTNTTKDSLRILHSQLTGLGFPIDQSEIFTSLLAARNVIVNRQLRPLLFLEESAKEDFQGISEENPNAVVIGLAPSYFNYEYMTKALRLLQDGAPLIAIHKARYFKKKDGIHIGPGAFVAGLEFSAGITAEVVGKPEKLLFLESLSSMGVAPENAAMIGDDVKDDIEGAMKAGLQGILVKTGKYRAGDENKIVPPPTAVLEDFPAAVDYILSNWT